MSIGNLIGYLSPDTVADIPLSDCAVQGLFILHWTRIVGPWYTISSEEKPEPVRHVSPSELITKNTLFWKTIIKELLKEDATDTAMHLDENQLIVFLNHSVVEMPYGLGCQLLRVHKKYVLKDSNAEATV